MRPHTEHQSIVRAFDRRADSYRTQAKVQAQVAERVVETCVPLLRNDLKLLDLGTGDGIVAERLHHLNPSLHITALDSSGLMLERLPKREGLELIQADYDAIPLPDDSMDLVVSSSALQWSSDPATSLREWMRVLKPGGTLVFSCFTEGTLREWADSWAKADDFPHVNTLPSNTQLQQALDDLHARAVTSTTSTITTHFAELDGALNSVRAIGANRVLAKGRRKGMMGRKTWLAFATAYEQMRNDQGLPLSYQVFYGIAEK